MWHTCFVPSAERSKGDREADNMFSQGAHFKRDEHINKYTHGAGGGVVCASISTRHTCGLSKVVFFSAQGGRDGDGRRYPRAGL